MKTKSLLLLTIIFLAFALRFFRLEQLPAILNRDEAALAYNAYLLAETRQDEWQVAWPLTLKSFGDYKLPGYPYLLAVLFSFFQPSDFLVRLPSALAGVMLVVLVFFFARDVLRVKANSALLMAFLAAISPVFFFYSRSAFEANFALLFFVFGLYLLFRNKRQVLLASLCLLIAVLTYNTPLLLLPLLLPALIYDQGVKNYKKWLWPSLLILAIFVWGAINFFSLASQKSGITIFNDSSTWLAYAQYRASFNGLWQALLGNQYVFYAKLMWTNLVESFSLSFLVKNGGSHPWHNLAGFGHLFYSAYFLALFMLIDFLGELVVRLFDQSAKLVKRHLLWLYLLLVSLAPSVVTVDSPHATRSLLFFFMLLCLATLFFDKLTRIFSKQSKVISLLVVGLLLLEATIYYRHYFMVYPDNQPESLFVAYPQLLREAVNKYSEQKVAVIDGGGYQYILTAWYLRVPAEQFFATMKYQDADSINFYYGEKLLNYHFIKEIEDLQAEEKIIISQSLGLQVYD